METPFETGTISFFGRVVKSSKSVRSIRLSFDNDDRAVFRLAGAIDCTVQCSDVDRWKGVLPHRCRWSISIAKYSSDRHHSNPGSTGGILVQGTVSHDSSQSPDRCRSWNDSIHSLSGQVRFLPVLRVRRSPDVSSLEFVSLVVFNVHQHENKPFDTRTNRDKLSHVSTLSRTRNILSMSPQASIRSPYVSK